MRKRLPSQGIALIIAQLVLIVNVIVVPMAYAEGISEEKEGAISVGCSSIKVTLKALQKQDSRMRVYLGSKYEIVLSNFMTNLNLRLIKNNLASEELAGLQTTFSSERERFKSDFTGYSQSLESLIAIDCQSEPQRFYDQLVEVREKRSDVQASYNRLNDVLGWHKQEVMGLKEEL
ncbi:MAG: hypothetical protein ACK5MU_01750 [Candidatus Saccharimonadales bacterium]